MCSKSTGCPFFLCRFFFPCSRRKAHQDAGRGGSSNGVWEPGARAWRCHVAGALVLGLGFRVWGLARESTRVRERERESERARENPTHCTLLTLLINLRYINLRYLSRSLVLSLSRSRSLSRARSLSLSVQGFMCVCARAKYNMLL